MMSELIEVKGNEWYDDECPYGMIGCYAKGSDITILNAMYQYPVQDKETGKWTKDFMLIVYRDNVTGKKNHEIIYNPPYTFYKTKEGIPVPDHPLFFIDREKVEAVTVPYKQLEKKIAEITDNMDFYEGNIRDGNRGENKKLHLDPRIFSSDMNIEDHYRFWFSKQYTNNIFKLHKAFFDIECDTKYMKGDFVESGECPVNMISLHDEYYDTTISYILRNNKNPLIAQFENDVATGVINEDFIRSFVRENVGGWKQEKRLNLDQTKYRLLFFDDELEMLTSFFHQVIVFDPDFIMGWNSSAFDFQYLVDRIVNLGGDPLDIICDPRYEVKLLKNYIDQRNLNEFAERGDYTAISSNTVWIDQMIQYASRRKAKIGSFKSFKLDDIGNQVAHVRKLSYHHITKDIAELPYLDFKTFALYNIMDVVVQKCIETKSQDLEYIFSKCIVNCTSYRKGHRQTVYLINRMTTEFDKMGFVIGNNSNKFNTEKEPFEGAQVLDPNRVGNYSKMSIGDRHILVGNNLMDFDFKSLYPSVIGENNIAPNTQIGMIKIPNKIYENENIYQKPMYSRGGEFIENMNCDNNVEFCKRWFHLAGITEFLEDMNEYRGKYETYGSQYNRFYMKNGKLVENPLYDLKNYAPVYQINTNNKPIYVFSNLKDNGISNRFEDIRGKEDD